MESERTTRGAPIMLWPIIGRPIVDYRLFISGLIFIQ